MFFLYHSWYTQLKIKIKKKFSINFNKFLTPGKLKFVNQIKFVKV